MFKMSSVQVCGRMGATNWENVYYLCILLVSISNYTTMHGVGHMKLGILL
jgi:hypothetical protein